MRKKTAHTQNRFLNCLRIQIVPGYHEEQRIESIVQFCRKHKFDNVMLFINAEEYCVGHMTKEEARPWVETMKKAKIALKAADITVSLNPWMELGHLDRGRKLKAGQSFVTMVDYNGRQAELVVCPLDESWLCYFLDFYAYLIREIEPETVWIEDDFRLHNHGSLEYGGCFCEHHMKAFNEKLGTDYNREEFTDRLFRKHPEERVRKAYMDVNRESMVRLAERIGHMIHELGLNTKVGLMSSMHQVHSMEFRDWNGIHKGLSCGGPNISRLHLPLYMEEISLKKYYILFNYGPFICRGYLPEDCHVLPELENALFMTYAKEQEALQFQLESAIPLEIEGMTYDIFDFVGNGAVEEFGYGEEVEKITDYLTAVMESGYSYHNLSGITILLDEKNAYNRNIKKNKFMELYPDDFALGVYLQGNGISARCSKEKEFADEVIVLAGGGVNNLSDGQLEALFCNNHVILEAGAVLNLLERDLGGLIGASGCRRYVKEEDVQSYEQIEGDTLVNNIPGYRASAFCQTGDYVSIAYDTTPMVRSRVFDFTGREIGYGMVEMGGHLIIPYVVDDLFVSHMHPLRRQIICDYIDSLKKEFVRMDYSGTYAYYSKAEENVLILVNPTLHSLAATRFKLTGEQAVQIFEIGRDGERREREFTVEGDGFVCLDEPFEALTTKTFVLVLKPA